MADPKWKRNIGITTARNPGAIANEQHDDKSLSQRSQNGTPGTYEQIISNAATAQVVPDLCVLRVANTSATTQFLFIGILADVPGAAPTIANGLALPPNSAQNVFLGAPVNDQQSIYIKASDNGVQVAVFEL